ncbi:MAG: hypothetical protein GY797_23285 [Deltaproteobacteria bacterium]|nr:hypothetical protein [Deltaproteobacteria bacterium]
MKNTAQQNQYRGLLEQGLALGKQVNNLLILVSGHITLARINQAQGDSEAAQAHIQQAETLGMSSK